MDEGARHDRGPEPARRAGGRLVVQAEPCTSRSGRIRSRAKRKRWLQAGAALAALLAGAFALNGLYQVARKPAELFFPVRGVLSKTPAQTWAQYQPIFREHATAVITPELLAALAQVEGSGNPVATPDWRLRLTAQPFELYRPASSAVGMYQITDGAFAEGKRYCIHDHAVVEDGPLTSFRSCWFNSLYSRVVPSHAVEMTSALLDYKVRTILAGRRMNAATLAQKQDLAALIHLCGAAAGELYARREFRLAPRQRCGEHDAASYLSRVNAMQRLFAQLR